MKQKKTVGRPKKEKTKVYFRRIPVSRFEAASTNLDEILKKYKK